MYDQFLMTLLRKHQDDRYFIKYVALSLLQGTLYPQ